VPSGYRWKCKECRKHFYTTSRPHLASTMAVPPQICPRHHPKCEASYAGHIKFLRRHHGPLLDSVGVTRERRTLPGDDGAFERKYRKLADVAETEDEVEVEDPRDPSFAPPAEHFEARMRYTPGARQDVHPESRLSVLNLTKLMAFQIGAPTGRASNQNAVMGGRKAWEIAGRGDYAVNKVTSSEWCHLQGLSLGGPNIASNLVSASFAANTEMYVMEMLLRGKTDLFVTVKSYVKSMAKDEADVVEFIEYIIRAGKLDDKERDFVRWIDGRSDAFSGLDASLLRDQLNAWMTKNRKPYAVQLDKSFMS